MTMLTFYVDGKVSDSCVAGFLVKAFQLDAKAISQLQDCSDAEVTFEINKIGRDGFSSEINVFLDAALARKSGMYNNLLLGIAISRMAKCGILINDESDDPYQWILIEGDVVFLAESGCDESEDINMRINSRRVLDINFALGVFPGENDFDSERVKGSAYLVTPSSKWESGVIKC